MSREASYGGTGSGKTESYVVARTAPPKGRSSHAQVSRPGLNTGLYTIPRTGMDFCPTCHTGTLHPIGADDNDMHFACSDDSCGQRVVRAKNMSLSDFAREG